MSPTAAGCVTGHSRGSAPMRLDRERQRVNGAMGAFPFRYRKISKAGFYPICRPRRPQTRPQPVTTPTYGPTTPESYPPAPRPQRARGPDNRNPAKPAGGRNHRETAPTTNRDATLNNRKPAKPAGGRNHRETARTTNRDATLNNRNRRAPGGVGGRSPPLERSDGRSVEAWRRTPGGALARLGSRRQPRLG